MAWIPMKRAFQACLWLVEEKFGISVNNRLGSWVLDSDSDNGITFTRRSIIDCLGADYFDSSMFHFDDDEEGLFWFSNLIDGKLEYSEHDFPDGLGIDLLDDMVEVMLQDHPLSHLAKAIAITDRNIIETTAHLLLMHMLTKGSINARGYEQFIFVPSDVTNRELGTSAVYSIPSNFWADKLIPNYDVSAVDHGTMFNTYILKRWSEAGLKGTPPEIPPGAELWLTNLEVDDRFEAWFTERLYKVFPVPESAILKPISGSNYLVQFGTDTPRKIKANAGLKLIREIIKNSSQKINGAIANTSPSSLQQAQLTEEMKSLDYMFEQDKSFPKSKLPAYKNKQKKMLLHIILQYLEHREQESNGEGLEVYNIDANYSAESTAKNLLKRAHRLRRAGGLDYTNWCHKLIAIKDVNLFPSRQELREMFKIELTNEEKLRENQIKIIRNELKKIIQYCPHFCYHIGNVESMQEQGIGYTPDAFYYKPCAVIKWDLG